MHSLASVARTVNENVPSLVGVPARTPLEESDSPGGGVPATTRTETGAVPPDAVIDWTQAVVAEAV